MANFVGNCDPKIQPGVLANGGRLLPVTGGREISEAQQVAVRQVVRADVVSGKKQLERFGPLSDYLPPVCRLKKGGGREDGSPRDEDAYVEVIRVIRVLRVQLVGPGGETGQCIFGVGTNGQIYLRENHFEMEWNHFGTCVSGIRLSNEVRVFCDVSYVEEKSMIKMYVLKD